MPQTALPPGPRMPLPLQALGWYSRPVPWLTRLQKRYGDVFTVRIAPAEGHWVMLAHPDAVREVFTGDPDKLLAGKGNEILKPVLGANSVLLLDREQHLRQRRLLLPPFHGDRLKRHRELMQRVADEEIARWPGGEAFSLSPRMQTLTLEIILHTVFGVHEGARLDDLRTALRDLLAFMTMPAAFVAAGLLGPERATTLPPARRVISRVDRLIDEEIEARRAAHDLADRDDILSMLIEARDEDGQPMTNAELRDELLTLLIAGHETTATALSWAIERLLRTPEAWDRLRNEASAGETTYSTAVIQETLRLRPVLPIVVRELAEPMTIAGWDLPAGVKVTPCIALVHRREDIYPDPLAFRPERFVDDPPGTYTWFPFGGGIRRCLGAAFAQQEMQIVLDSIVRSTDLRPSRPQGERIRRRAITFAPERGAEVVAA